MRGSSALFFNDKGDGGALSDYLSHDPAPDDGLAFADIINDDMTSLQKRLAEGLNPDTRFFFGNTILHLIALKAKDKSLNDDKYRAVLDQMVRCGGDLQARNDMGFSALDFLEGNKCDEFAEDVKHAQHIKIKAPVQKNLLDAQLATFSMQRNPSTQGKKWIIELIKTGANPEHIASNGKSVFENIKENWPEASANAFTQLVVAAKFKSAANGQDKSLAKAYVNDQWINAVMAFYKANPR